MIPGGRLEIVPGRDEIRLDGCGCFLLFQRECKGGEAYLLDRMGPHYYNLHTIGSIYREVRLHHHHHHNQPRKGIIIFAKVKVWTQTFAFCQGGIK